jgi:PAS domain S-box-containing protein
MTPEAANPRQAFEEHATFETLLAEFSSRFINLPPGEVDREIEDALRRVCEFVGVDLAVLWQWSGAAPGFVIPTHTYCVEEDLRPSEPMREDDYPWAVQQVLAGRTFAISSLEDYPAEAAVDRQTLQRYGVKSGVCLPLMVGGEPPVGALGLNVMHEERDWPDVLVKRLQLVAQVFANALARRRADQALRESEEVSRATFDQAAVGIAHVGIDGRWLRVNDKLCAIVGYPREELLHLTFQDITHPDDLEADLGYAGQVLSGEIKTYSMEKRYFRKDGSLVWINLTVSLVRGADGEPRNFISVVEDITDRKRAEDELRSLSRRLIRAQEEERALLARELHDDVTQRLAVLAIDAGRAELAGQGAFQAEALRAVREGLVRLSEDIHSLAYQLHPSILEELGLAEALRTECERRGRQGGVDFSLDLAPLPPVVGRDAALCLYRVAQEALNNVVHHAGARAAKVVLRQMEGGLLLAVRDDGVGFDPETARQKRSLGLASMRERLRLANGTLDIESAPGRGTAIVAWVPVQGEAS